MQTKKPKDPLINVSKDAKKLFDNMASRYDEFKNFRNKDFFILALLFGYVEGRKGRQKLSTGEKVPGGFAREAYLVDRDNALLKAVAVSEQGDTDLLNRENIADVYAIADEYANGGVDGLRRFIFENPASFAKKFADLLREHYARNVPQGKQKK